MLDNGDEALYLAQWSDRKPDHGIAVLIILPGEDEFFSVMYSFESTSFMVVSEEDYDWRLSDGMKIMDREKVTGTPLAPRIFSFLDEIWVHDRVVSKLYRKWDKR